MVADIPSACPTSCMTTESMSVSPLAGLVSGATPEKPVSNDIGTLLPYVYQSICWLRLRLLQSVCSIVNSVSVEGVGSMNHAA